MRVRVSLPAPVLTLLLLPLVLLDVLGCSSGGMIPARLWAWVRRYPLAPTRNANAEVQSGRVTLPRLALNNNITTGRRLRRLARRQNFGAWQTRRTGKPPRSSGRSPKGSDKNLRRCEKPPSNRVFSQSRLGKLPKLLGRRRRDRSSPLRMLAASRKIRGSLPKKPANSQSGPNKKRAHQQLGAAPRPAPAFNAVLSSVQKREGTLTHGNRITYPVVFA